MERRRQQEKEGGKGQSTLGAATGIKARHLLPAPRRYHAMSDTLLDSSSIGLGQTQTQTQTQTTIIYIDDEDAKDSDESDLNETEATPQGPTIAASGFLHNKVLSLSTTSIKSLIPNFYSITGGNNSSPTLVNTPGSPLYGEQPASTNHSSLSLKDTLFTQDPLNVVSDELARESDVTVSTNVTPQAEYKGFASYVISCIFLFTWICWSFMPDRVLNKMGVYYYPSRWWALAIPSYVIVLMMYMYVGIACYDVEYLTLPLDDNRNVVDDSGIVVTQLENFRAKDIDKYAYSGTSGVWDLPISTVNQILYSSAPDDDNLDLDRDLDLDIIVDFEDAGNGLAAAAAGLDTESEGTPR